MPAPVVGNRREGFQLQPRDEVTHFRFVMSDFAPSNEHPMLLQGRGKSRIYPAELPANSGPIPQGGSITNNTAVYGDNRTADDVVSYGKGNSCEKTRKNDVTVPPMSAEAGLFSADAYAGIGNISDIICSPEGDTRVEQRTRRNDMFFLDWPELGGFQDFETDLRKFGSAFENYFDDPMWPSICSPDAQLVPGSQFDNNDANSSAVASKSAANPILESTISVPDSTDETKMANLISMQQLSRNKGRETPSNCSSSEETGHFPRRLLCPFDDMLVPVSPPSILCNDEIIIPSSSTRSGPDDVVPVYVPRCSAKKKAHATTPDMMLDEMAENPLEMYFPPLTTYEQPEVPMSGASSTQMHQLLPGGFTGEGALNSSGLEFGSRGRRTPGGGLRESPPSSSIIRAVPVKHLGFQKLQEGMNQLDVGTKSCIRDALYRLANNVEQRQCVDQNVGSSDANRLKKSSSVWTETQGNPMVRSVAQLLLKKPLHRNTTHRQANRVA